MRIRTPVLVDLMKSPAIIVSFIQTLCIGVFFFFFGTPIYEINDDVFLTLIVSGKYTGTPQPYLFSIDILAGRLLTSLYAHFPHINWFSYLLYLFAFLSLWTVLYVLKKSIRSKLIYITALIFTLLFYFRSLLFLSFTIIGALTGISGVLLLGLPLENDNHLSKKKILTGLMLFLVSNFIRMGSLELSVIPASLILFYKILKQKYNRRFLLTAALVSVIIIGISRLNNAKTYNHNDPLWKDSYAMVPLSWCSYSPSACMYGSHREAYQAGGWSENDYFMNLFFFYEDKKIFSEKNTQLISSNIQWEKSFVDMLKLFPVHISYKIAVNFEYLMLIAIVCLNMWKTIDKRHRKVIALNLLFCAILICFFSFRGYLPDRVMLPVLFFAGILILTSATGNLEVKFNSISTKEAVLYSFFASVVLIMAFKIVAANGMNKEKIANFKSLFSKLPSGNNLTFIWGSTVPYEWQNPLGNLEAMDGKHILIGAWTLRTPYNEEVKRQFGIYDLYVDLYKKSNIYLLASDMQLGMLKMYMMEHYKHRIEFNKINDFKEYKLGSGIFKVLMVD